MHQISTTIHEVGAWPDSAQNQASPFQAAGAVAEQPQFPAVARRDIMTAVNLCAGRLGLRPASVVVLDALLSCLPCQDAEGDRLVSPEMLLTIYASNKTLCFRAKGLTDRQLRRHL